MDEWKSISELVGNVGVPAALLLALGVFVWRIGNKAATAHINLVETLTNSSRAQTESTLAIEKAIEGNYKAHERTQELVRAVHEDVKVLVPRRPR